MFSRERNQTFGIPLISLFLVCFRGREGSSEPDLEQPADMGVRVGRVHQNPTWSNPPTWGCESGGFIRTRPGATKPRGFATPVGRTPPGVSGHPVPEAPGEPRAIHGRSIARWGRRSGGGERQHSPQDRPQNGSTVGHRFSRSSFHNCSGVCSREALSPPHGQPRVLGCVIGGFEEPVLSRRRPAPATIYKSSPRQNLDLICDSICMQRNQKTGTSDGTR